MDGDALAWRWSLTGTHVGPFAGMAPTRRQVTLRGVNFQRLRDAGASRTGQLTPGPL